jgi:hypothetical protein
MWSSLSRQRGTIMTTVDINHFWIEPDGGSGWPLLGYEVKDFVRQAEDYGAVIVRMGVDGHFDHVQADFAQTDDITGLTRAIAALTVVRAELEALYEARGRRPGRCLESGDYGRCRTTEGHEGDHVFPTQEDWQAEYDALSQARAARAKTA